MFNSKQFGARLEARLWVLCTIIGLSAGGCIASTAFTRAEVAELRDENLNHRPYLVDERRRVVVTGDQAAKIASLFPEIGVKPAEEEFPDSNPRFEILLTRANGQQYRVEVQSTTSDNPCWFDATVHSTHVLNLAAVPILNDLIRNAKENPFVEAYIMQLRDDSNRFYETPIQYAEFEPREIEQLFPELRPLVSSQEKMEPKGELVPNFSIVVELMRANGDQLEITVGPKNWALHARTGDVAQYPLHPSTAKELRERLSSVGRVLTPPTSRPLGRAD